jgi:two-component system, chemotaxis family, chemotaxis protein CheY
MSSNAEMDRKTCQVLIIEDDQDDAFLLKRALKAAALENGIALGVTHNVNGLDALGSVARGDILGRLPAVIIVDLNMPVLNGGRFLDFLRADMQLRAVPAVVLTTSTEKPVHAQALASGADAVFSKPNTQEELVEIARRILRMGGCVASPAALH